MSLRATRLSTALVSLPTLLVLSLAACDRSGPATGPAPGGDVSPGPHTAATTVPSGGSIQAALDAAAPGDRIVVEPGVYREALRIDKPGIRLVGATGPGGPNGDAVVLEDPGEEEDGITVTSDGVEIRNLTVRGFEENGILLTGVDGFRLVDIVAEDDGEYGLFPVHSRHGTILRCTASGHTDTGIYIGQSEDVRILDSEAFGNVNGFEIENASHIVARANRSHGNTAGFLVVLLPGLDVKTASDIVLSGNTVTANNHPNFADPEEIEAAVPAGSGILVVGTDATTVEGNHVTGHDFVGVGVASTAVLATLAGVPPAAIDVEPDPDGVRIRGNTVTGNGANAPPGFPFPGVDLLWDGSGTDDCWIGNHYGTSFPPRLPRCGES